MEAMLAVGKPGKSRDILEGVYICTLYVEKISQQVIIFHWKKESIQVAIYEVTAMNATSKTVHC